MGYFWLEEHGLIRHPAVEATNTEGEAVDFARWVREGLLRAKEKNCTGATEQKSSR